MPDQTLKIGDSCRVLGLVILALEEDRQAVEGVILLAGEGVGFEAVLAVEIGGVGAPASTWRTIRALNSRCQMSIILFLTSLYILLVLITVLVQS